MELTIEPPTPPRQKLGGDLERAGTLRDLTLPRGLSDAALGNAASALVRAVPETAYHLRHFSTPCRLCVTVGLAGWC